MLPELFKDLIALPWIALRSRRSCTDDPQERLKTRTAKIPDALSPKRKELSISYNSAVNASSPLLTKLPLELRQKIYTYALGSHLVHILLTPSRIAHFCCTCPTFTDFNRACCPSARHLIVPKSVPIPPSPIAIALLRTCRQIYAEAIPILYSSNTFDIDDLRAFVLLAGNVPSRGLSAIKSLHLSWSADYPPLQFAATASATKAPYDDATYLRFWDMVASQMPALRELRMAIQDMWWVRTLEVEDPWVQPVKHVKGLDVFELEVVEPSYRFWEKGQVDTFAAELKRVVCRGKGVNT